jgi:hypothetical protein
MAIAADRLGRRCAPLVCAGGIPAAAQRTLLARLVECGAELAYHDDIRRLAFLASFIHMRCMTVAVITFANLWWRST